MHIARYFTTAGQDPSATVPFRTATSEIRNPDGSVVFQAEGIEVPTEWSQVACDILAQKYFRKAGVPALLAAVAEEGVPCWLWRHTADEAGLAAFGPGAPPRGGNKTPPGFHPPARDRALLGLEGRGVYIAGGGP